ncbi:WD repeat-containing protein 44 isoform X2 [Leptinotarsa decemlineata]|uniref:WD repeat-containing protein 44 isoform X2 n=1 Tax=Leptinotarsa decemlineata TaxID=7539 RepID=UPI003D305F63
MHSDSDSDNFYDAEDFTSTQNSRIVRNTADHSSNSGNTSVFETRQIKDLRPNIHKSSDSRLNEPEQPNESFIGGKKRFQEIRQKLQIDDDDYHSSNVTPPNSQNSSVDGISVGSSRTSHPFRIIEQDTISLQSLNSLGRVGRILVGNVDSESGRKALSVTALSSSSLDSVSIDYPEQVQQCTSTITLLADDFVDEKRLPLQEPDVIASTKSNVAHQHSGAPCLHISPKLDVPIAPPRRRKKHIKSTGLALKTSDLIPLEPPELASPASTIESLTREFEHSLDQFPPSKLDECDKFLPSEMKSFDLNTGHSLDIRQALKGQFVVKPQDNNIPKGHISIRNIHNNEENINLSTEIKNSENGARGSSNRSSLGHYSLGPHRGTHQHERKTPVRERRKSAGDENFLKNLFHVRTHTDSGKQLSDLEILEQVTVLNLDTGERVPLSVAEDKLPQCVNPLSLHIMRITSEYVSNSNMDKDKESDEESVDKISELPIVGEHDLEIGRLKQKTAKFKQFLGSTVKKTVHRAKTIAHEVSHARHKEDTIDIVDNVHPGEHNCKLKASNSHKGPYEFEKVEHVQELKDDQHEGPIWCMKFSGCGRLLATAGQDKILRIWIVESAYQFFQEMRTKYNSEKVSPTPSTESLTSHHSADISAYEGLPSESSKLTFMPKTFCTYTGHTSDLLDVSWSKNYFILSSSMDKTVRLWHISRKECLCCFQHIDFVTAIVFHPRDDRYFLSGSLDGKLRLWNIPDKKVAVWNEVEGNPKLITAANFCQNGKFAVVGTYDGRCIFYITDQLKYHTQIHVRSSRGRNAVGRKISGIEPMPGEDKILVTSNDSRIRLYDLRDLNVSCKYKGYVNMSSQIKASFSHDGKYIVSGSENRDIYIWRTSHDYSKFSSVRRDRNDFWEAIKAHNATVTCAIFAPNPEAIIKALEDKSKDNIEFEEKIEDPLVQQHSKGFGGYVLISADFSGCIKVFINKTKPKHSSLPVSAMS